MSIVLVCLGLWLAAVAALAGFYQVLRLMILAVLRRWHPTSRDQRVYLLRGRSYWQPSLNDEEHLQRLQRGGSAWIALGWGWFPVMFLSELLERWMGVIPMDRFAWNIEVAGLLLGLSMVFSGALVAARARIAATVLQNRQNP